MSGIVDIDELILQCRDKQAKEYIKEAMACYNAGAYRSCVVATWNAVVFDFLHKLSELKLTGDKNAEKKLQEFEKIREGGGHELKKALDFERDILNVAANDFELLTPLEKLDLCRLQDDRNRCAHPSMQSDDEPYQPTAELARMHIRNAVEIMLKREPVQGKAALERICKQIESEYFPEDLAAAKIQLEHGPLKRSRKALVRNIVIVIIKRIFYDTTLINEKKRQVAALSAIFEMHRTTAEEAIKADLPSIISNVSDDLLRMTLFLAMYIPVCWEYFGRANQEKIIEYVRSIESKDKYFTTCMVRAYKIDALKVIVENRIEEMNETTLAKVISQSNSLSEITIDKVIERFSSAGSFRSAESLGHKLILPLADRLTVVQLTRIMQAVSKNNQIYDASDMQSILIPLFEKTTRYFEQLKTEWESLLKFLLESARKGNLRISHGYVRFGNKLKESGIIVEVPNEVTAIPDVSEEDCFEPPNDTDVPF